MLKKITVVILFIFSKNSYSQEKYTIDYIITMSNDTIRGKLEDVNFYKANKIKIVTKEGKKKYSVKKLKELQVKGEKYTRRKKISNKKTPDSVYANHFTKPLVETGEIQAFQENKIVYLTRNRTIFNRTLLKFYADDYPGTIKFLKQKKNSDSLLTFIKAYNAFSEQHPNSRSFAEKNLHYKKFFNPQLAINLIGLKPAYGYVGAELGINKVLTFTPRISYLYAIVDTTGGKRKTAMVPFAELGVKYYLFNACRIKNERSTFRYSGYNLSVTYMQPFQENITRALRMEFGFKAVAFNRMYLDYSLGSIYSIENRKAQVWGFIGLGYLFY